MACCCQSPSTTAPAPIVLYGAGGAVAAGQPLVTSVSTVLPQVQQPTRKRFPWELLIAIGILLATSEWS